MRSLGKQFLLLSSHFIPQKVSWFLWNSEFFVVFRFIVCINKFFLIHNAVKYYLQQNMSPLSSRDKSCHTACQCTKAYKHCCLFNWFLTVNMCAVLALSGLEHFAFCFFKMFIFLNKCGKSKFECSCTLNILASWYTGFSYN